MIRIKKAFAVALLATTSIPVMATTTVDLGVTGSITPSACTPSLGNDGAVNYGTIRSTSLSESYTVLEEKQITFNITCDSPVPVALKLINRRVGSLAGALEDGFGVGVSPVPLLGSAPQRAAGLGLAGDKKIGGYAVSLSSVSVMPDPGSVDNISSVNNGSSWTQNSNGVLTYGDTLNSWASSSELTPLPLQTLTGSLSVQAYLNIASALDLGNEIALNGMSTLELVYL